MNIAWRAVAVFIAGLILIEIIYLRHESQRVVELRDVLGKTYKIGLDLEKEIGYGGLIHNFKNYLLRSGEENYYEAASRNAEAASVLIDRLEQNAAELGQPLVLTETRNMVAAYKNRLETIASMSAEEASAREIDAIVRYTDDYALAEVNEATAMITSVVNDRLIGLARTSQLQLTVIFILIAGGVIYFSYTQRGLIRQAEEITKAHKALLKSNDNLSRSNLALRQFAGIASHDLKSPVRHISLLADMAERHSDEPEKAALYIRDIRSAARRMNFLVTSLLDFTKTGFKTPKIEKVDFNAVISDVVSDLANDIKEKNAELVVDPLPTLAADPELMRRVFANLISNSLKYATNGAVPKIVISAEQKPGSTVFSVADNGIGVDAQFADKIFEPMQRLHASSEYEGAGIGLSLVKAIIESHGGSMWLDKQYDGGARFCFNLPET